MGRLEFISKRPESIVHGFYCIYNDFNKISRMIILKRHWILDS